jgi:hypothetical protein
MDAQTRARPHARAIGISTSIAAVIVAGAVALIPSVAHAAIGTPVPLGATSAFAVLAGAGVTNTGATTLGGDVGSFPTTSIAGLGTITLVGGVDRSGDAVTEQAKTDLETAYNAASAQSPDSVDGVELAGRTLEPGVYSTGGVIELNGNLTLDGNGDPNAVFVFQSLSTLLAGSGSSITFIDGATACNLYWRVPSSATIQAGSQFAGTILAAMTITFGAGATLDGRALAQDGEVTMINNTITRPACSAVTPSEAPSETPSGTDSTQVAVAPSGGVATGDGSTVARVSGGWVLLGAAALTGFGAMVWHRARSRRPHLDR